MERAVASISACAALDRKHPDREDGAQRYQTADSPSGCVGDFVVAGAAHRVGFRGHRAPLHGTAPESLPATITPAEIAGSISGPGSLKTPKSQELERALVLRRWPGYRRQGGKITSKPASDDWSRRAEPLPGHER